MTEEKSIIKLLGSGQYDNVFAQVLPKGIPITVFRGILENCVRRNPKLAQCDPASFFAAARRLAELGLRADGRQAYLIPFENHKKGIVEVQLIVSYLGLQDLLFATGRVLAIRADNVHENDDFDHDLGVVTRHTYRLGSNRGAYIGSYCQIEWENGATTAAVMQAEEVEQIRRSSKAFASGPHQSHPGEMRKKTAIRRAMKHAPLGLEAAVADDDVIEVESTVESAPAANPKLKRPVQLKNSEPAQPPESAADSDRSSLPVTEPEPVKRGPGRPPKSATAAPAPSEIGSIPVEAIPKFIRSKLDSTGVSEAQLLDYLRSRGMEESLSSLDEMIDLQPLALKTLLGEIDATISAALKIDKESV